MAPETQSRCECEHAQAIGQKSLCDVVSFIQVGRIKVQMQGQKKGDRVDQARYIVDARAIEPFGCLILNTRSSATTEPSVLISKLATHSMATFKEGSFECG
jgi:hypothetical protein